MTVADVCASRSSWHNGYVVVRVCHGPNTAAEGREGGAQMKHCCSRAAARSLMMSRRGRGLYVTTLFARVLCVFSARVVSIGCTWRRAYGFPACGGSDLRYLKHDLVFAYVTVPVLVQSMSNSRGGHFQLYSSKRFNYKSQYSLVLSKLKGTVSESQ